MVGGHWTVEAILYVDRTVTKESISQVLRMYLENDGIEFSWSYLCLYILMVGGLAQQCWDNNQTLHNQTSSLLPCPSRAA